MSSDRKMPDDRELEDFLVGRHPAGRAYREASEHDTAPPGLDAAILSAAREAVRTPRARRPRWFQPVAVAATLALSLGVLLNIWRDPETRGQMAPAAEPDLDRMKAQAVEEGVLPPVVEAKKEAGPSLPAEPSAAAESGAPAEAVEAEIERRSDAVAARRESKAPRDEPRKSKEAASGNSASPALSAGVAPPKTEAPKLEPRTPEAPGPDPDATASSYGFVPEPPAQPAPPPAPVTAPSPGVQRAAPIGAAADRMSDDRVDEAPGGAPKDAGRARDATESTSGARSGLAEEDGAAAGAIAPRTAPSASSAAPAAKASQREAETSDGFAPAPPEDWIRRIRELRDGGDAAAAKRLLDSFRARYPDYALPEDLRELQRL